MKDQQAFPTIREGMGGIPGMTMRQYYKAKALPSLLMPASDGSMYPSDAYDKMAIQAGLIADAMLAEDEEHANKEAP